MQIVPPSFAALGARVHVEEFASHAHHENENDCIDINNDDGGENDVQQRLVVCDAFDTGMLPGRT